MENTDTNFIRVYYEVQLDVTAVGQYLLRMTLPMVTVSRGTSKDFVALAFLLFECIRHKATRTCSPQGHDELIL